jgi:hypothetical protein
MVSCNACLVLAWLDLMNFQERLTNKYFNKQALKKINYLLLSKSILTLKI